MALITLKNSDKTRKYTIDATQLNNNFNYLLSLFISSGGIISGLDSERGNPTTMLLYWATDTQALYFFTNNTSIGSGGWITIGGA
jgi:hypothetical protein